MATGETRRDQLSTVVDDSNGTVLAAFNAEEQSELSVTASERIEVLSRAPAPDGWVWARNSLGQEGLVPASYIDRDCGPQAPLSMLSRTKAKLEAAKARTHRERDHLKRSLPSGAAARGLAARRVAESLLAAAESGDPDRVVGLLSLGAPVDATRGDGGATPLLLASKGAHASTVSVLLEHGADPSVAKANGSTPLFAAAAANADEVIWLLHQAGAVIDAPNAHGVTPLHVAAQKDHLLSVRALLNLGADGDAADAAGNSALHKAARSNAVDAIDALLAHARRKYESVVSEGRGDGVVASGVAPTPEVRVRLSERTARLELVVSGGSGSGKSGGDAGVHALLLRTNGAGQTALDLSMDAGAAAASGRLLAEERACARSLHTSLSTRVEALGYEATRYAKARAAATAARSQERAKGAARLAEMRASLAAAEAERGTLRTVLAAAKAEGEQIAVQLRDKEGELWRENKRHMVTTAALRAADEKMGGLECELAELSMELRAANEKMGGLEREMAEKAGELSRVTAALSVESKRHVVTTEALRAADEKMGGLERELAELRTAKEGGAVVRGAAYEASAESQLTHAESQLTHAESQLTHAESQLTHGQASEGTLAGAIEAESQLKDALVAAVCESTDDVPPPRSTQATDGGTPSEALDKGAMDVGRASDVLKDALVATVGDESTPGSQDVGHCDAPAPAAATCDSDGGST